MRKIIIVTSLLLTGCQLGDWQPYSVFNQPTSQPTTTEAAQIQASSTPAACHVIADALNLRTGPGTAHTVKAWLAAGDLLTITDQRGEWLHVRTAAGVTGWIHSNYCRGVK